MTFGLTDHLFVIVVIGLVFPFFGWWAYRRFLERLKREGGAALIREYQQTLIWLLGLGLGAMALWHFAGRDWAAMGFAVSRDSGAAAGIAIGAFAGLALRPILVAFSPKAAAGIRKQFGPLEAILPRDGRQLCWGLIVSVFAGVFEEIAYRGYLMAYFGTWQGPWGALAASSLLFGLAHLYQGKWGVPVTALLGALFGWVYIETGSLLLPILLHAAVDISSMVTAWIVLRAAPPSSPESQS
ncbi:MAG TPA: CPBP family intramembrane glutamic endopeptidase [Allosphingosinicella sp.]|jgi:membrane protease YdiL (CAAX protease family)|nr:CPBP family intramembrane glutamic endopeptidase [Allosphingosinicella sp.]